ncbi:MAG: LuxR C-terminal-related transcriptional regulator [Chloroflexota bacterium]
MSPSLRRFLLRTSPLDRFDASLADHVTQTTDSAETLAELERTNAFLVPLEGRSRWYRYHHLFRDLLVTELRRSEPSSEALVQRRAAQWFVTHDDPSAAIEYAHQAGDDDLVASLLVTSGMRQYRAGRLTTLDRWFGWFAVEGLAGSPALAILGAWIWALSGRTGRAERWEDALRPHVDALDPYLRAVYATLRSVTGRMSWDAQAAEARIAMDGLPDGDVWRASAFVGGGIHELLHGDLTAGDVLLARAVDIGVENHAIPATSAALGFRAQVAIARGDWDHAEELVRDAASLIADERLEHYATSAIAFATRARIAIHRGAHDAAQRDIALLQRLRPGLTAAIPYLAVRVRLELAQAYLELGEVAGARLMLSEAADVVAVRPGVAALADEVSALRARAGQPRGGIGVASLTTAELRLLGYMPSHLTFREIASRLFVSVNTVKTQAISTYTKLGVSSRSAAVDAAVEAGLLDRAITRFPVAGPDIDLDRLTHATTSRVAPAR